MPSEYQKASLKALLGLFLEAQGHPLPQQTQIKSASSLSRFLNHYLWSTRTVIRTTRQTMVQQVAQHRLRKDLPLQVLIDLTSLEKCGKFLQLSTPTENLEPPDLWVRLLNGKRGLHLVVLYLEMGEWRMPWSFRVWHGKGYVSPSQLACKLLAQVPSALSNDRTVIVLADTEFETVDFIAAVKKQTWRAVVEMRCNRKLVDGRSLKQLYRTGKRRQQVYLEGISYRRTVSWFWLKRAEGKRELRFVVSTHPYAGVYLIRLGRKRWAIEGFFKTIKHRFGFHRFGQSTKLGVYRWLILAWVAYLLAYWMDQWSLPPVLDWKAASDLALKILFPAIIWFQLLKLIRCHTEIAAQHGFDIVLKPLSNWAYRECCKI